MTSVVMNGKNYEATLSTMRDVLALAGSHLEIGHVIARVQVDGTDAPSFTDERFLGSSAKDVALVQIESQPIRDLLRRGLDLERNFLLEVTNDLGPIALAFRKSEAAKASETLVLVADGLKSLIQVLQGVSSFFPELYRTFKHKELSIDAHLREFSKVLESVHLAQSRRDWVLLADVIEYEVNGVVEEWVRLLDGLCDAIQVAAA